MDFFITFLQIFFVLLCVGIVGLVLLQRSNNQGGLGAAMGGGMTESVLGADSESQLRGWTKNAVILFFVGMFGLYLLVLATRDKGASESELPSFGTSVEDSSTLPITGGLGNLPVEIDVSSDTAETVVEEAAEETEVPATD